MAYIEHTDIQTFLNITLTPGGIATVDALIPAVEAYAESYCNRNWSVSGAQTETFDGGTDIFFVSHPPIQSITSVTDNGITMDPANYRFYRTYVRTLNHTYTSVQGVTIVYTSSISLPDDLKLALIRWVSELFKSSEDAGKTTRRVKAGSVEIDYLTQDGIPAYVEMVLKRYKLHAV